MFKVYTPSCSLQLKPSVAFEIPSQISPSVPEAGCLRLTATFLQFDDCFRIRMALVIILCCPDMVVQGFSNGEFGDHWSLAMNYGQLACSQSCKIQIVCTGLLEESVGQQSSAVFDKIRKKTINIINTVDLGFLIDKMQSILFATETHPSWDHHVLFVNFSRWTKRRDDLTSAFLLVVQTLLFWLLSEGFR